jgi:beta-xylosidase
VAVVVTVVVALVAVVPQITAADAVHYPPKASGPNPGLVVDPTVNHPDPSILWDPVAHLYRMYTTDTWSDGAVPEYTAEKLSGPWTDQGNVLAGLPSWEGRGFETWAPEVADINGVWTMWGSTSDGEFGADHNPMCIYRATAPSPAGPFVVDPTRAPCDLLLGGDIDPSAFEVGNQWWLVDKTNAYAVDRPTVMYSQRIGANGELTGPRYEVLTPDLPWEQGLIEAPNFVQSPNHQWWLVFSGGNFNPPVPTYRIAAVPCAGPEGGCDDSRAVVLVAPNLQGNAPGEQETFQDESGQWWLAYNPGGPLSTDRPLVLNELNFNAKGIPYISTP